MSAPRGRGLHRLFPPGRRPSGPAAGAPRRHLGLLRVSPKVLDDIEGLLTDNRIFKQRNVDIGVISLEAFAWGFSGVMVQGSGAAWGPPQGAAL